VITDAKQHEIKVAKGHDLPLLSDSIISVDRAYIDYKWFYSLKRSKVSFVTRAKSNMKYKVIGQHEVDKTKGLLFDKEVMLTGFYQSRYYPEKLRLIGFKDPETKKKLIFLTNNFSLSAHTITQGCSITKVVFMSFLRKQESRRRPCESRELSRGSGFPFSRETLDSRFHGNDEVAVGENLICLRSFDFQGFASF